MKPIIAAAIVSLIAGAAVAQTTTTVTKETTITRQDEPRIKEYVMKEHVQPVPPPAGWNAAPGVVIPETVELHPFPTDVPWHTYRYAVIGGETVLVDPTTRHIVSVIR
jgi:hypothetical protein